MSWNILFQPSHQSMGTVTRRRNKHTDATLQGFRNACSHIFIVTTSLKHLAVALVWTCVEMHWSRSWPLSALFHSSLQIHSAPSPFLLWAWEADVHHPAPFGFGWDLWWGCIRGDEEHGAIEGGVSIPQGCPARMLCFSCSLSSVALSIQLPSLGPRAWSILVPSCPMGTTAPCLLFPQKLP